MDEIKFYDSAFVMELFHIKQTNYSTFSRICRKLKLPRIKIGKRVFFPKVQFDKRLNAITQEGMKNFNL